MQFVDRRRQRGHARCGRDWKPGEPVWPGTVDGEPVAVQVRPVAERLRPGASRRRGARPIVYTEREAAAARADAGQEGRRHRQAAALPDAGPGASRSRSTEGQEVKAGETLAVVEAMKMENVLRAERDGTVKKINAKPGDSLAVDAVIMEFA